MFDDTGGYNESIHDLPMNYEPHETSVAKSQPKRTPSRWGTDVQFRRPEGGGPSALGRWTFITVTSYFLSYTYIV